MAYQSQALKLDPGFFPAQLKYVQDLLYLGKTKEGFELARKLHKEDPYHLTLFNLVQLADVYDKLIVVETNEFIIRIDVDDYKIFGDQVISFLKETHDKLVAKYGVKPNGKVSIDLYNNAEDFAIRNLGYPLEFGALGICFGNLVTLKTVDAQPSPHNWQEVVWHEYAHVLTLEMTKKMIPRWLTEGISVFEEWDSHEDWGMAMTMDFRERLLQGDLIPVKDLNAHFHSSDIHFAYYQSGLLVHYLVKTYGFEKLKSLLNDYPNSANTMALLAKHYGDVDKLFNEFKNDCLKKAKTLAPKADFTPFPENYDRRNPIALDRWLKEHPSHAQAILLRASLHMKAHEYTDAKILYLKLISVFPEYIWGDNPYEGLISIYRDAEDLANEKVILKKYIKRNKNAWSAYHRLIELKLKEGKYKDAADYAEKLLAIHPKQGIAYQAQARHLEQTGDLKSAIKHIDKALLCKNVNQADVNFSLAKLYKDQDLAKAKRHVFNMLGTSTSLQRGISFVIGNKGKRVNAKNANNLITVTDRFDQYIVGNCPPVRL